MAALCTVTAMDAEWKEFRPRIEADGKSFRDELVTVKGTRAQLMAHLEKLFSAWSPHEWIDSRRLVPRTASGRAVDITRYNALHLTR